MRVSGPSGASVAYCRLALRLERGPALVPAANLWRRSDRATRDCSIVAGEGRRSGVSLSICWNESLRAKAWPTNQ